MKLDITKLDGYKAGMTADEIVALLSKVDIPDPDYSGFVRKDTFDKTASELADWKKKYKDTLSDQERKAAEDAETSTKVQQELTQLRRERDVDRHKANYLGLGFTKELAAETAAALVEGKMDVVFANQAKHQEAMKSAMKTEILKNTPTPPGGSGPIDASAYAKKAEEAMASGDFAAGAYYTRLAQSQTTQGGT